MPPVFAGETITVLSEFRAVLRRWPLDWVHWHNHERLHGYLNDFPPAESEETFYATKRTDQTLVEIQ